MFHRLKLILLCASTLYSLLECCCSTPKDKPVRTLLDICSTKYQVAEMLRQTPLPEEDRISIPIATTAQRYAYSIAMSMPLANGTILCAELTASSTGIASSAVYLQGTKYPPFALSTFLALCEQSPELAPYGEPVKWFFTTYGLTFQADAFHARACQAQLLTDEEFKRTLQN